MFNLSSFNIVWRSLLLPMRLINKLLSIALLAATMLLSACPQERVIIRRVPVAAPTDRSLDDRTRPPTKVRIPARRPIPTRPKPVVRRPVPSQPVHKVCLFEEENFRGRSICGNPPLRVPNSAYVPVGGGKAPQNWSGRVQSIKILGNAMIRVYRAPKMQGGSLTVRGSLPNLREIRLVGGKMSNWVGQIESFTIFTNRPQRVAPRPLPATNQKKICFYEGLYYRGRPTCFPVGSSVPNLGRIAMRDNRYRNVDNRFLSMKVFGRTQARVWVGRGFRGRNIKLSYSRPDLRKIRTVNSGVVNWGQVISSLRIEHRR